MFVRIFFSPGRGKKSKTPQPMMLMPPPLIGPMVPPPNYPHYALPYPGTMTLKARYQNECN